MPDVTQRPCAARGGDDNPVPSAHHRPTISPAAPQKSTPRVSGPRDSRIHTRRGGALPLGVGTVPPPWGPAPWMPGWLGSLPCPEFTMMRPIAHTRCPDKGKKISTVSKPYLGTLGLTPACPEPGLFL